MDKGDVQKASRNMGAFTRYPRGNRASKRVTKLIWERIRFGLSSPAGDCKVLDEMNNDSTNIFTNREASIYLFALRYAMPRKTGAIDFVCHEITRNLSRFSEHYRAQMKSEALLEETGQECLLRLIDIL